MTVAGGIRIRTNAEVVSLDGVNKGFGHSVTLWALDGVVEVKP
jgi:hypothetical protein